MNGFLWSRTHRYADGCVTQSILDGFAQKSLKGCTIDCHMNTKLLCVAHQPGQFHGPFNCATSTFFHSFLFTMGVNKGAQIYAHA